jgi:hypothetical protein
MPIVKSTAEQKVPCIANAPRPDEIVVIVALADGGRPRPPR